MWVCLHGRRERPAHATCTPLEDTCMWRCARCFFFFFPSSFYCWMISQVIGWLNKVCVASDLVEASWGDRWSAGRCVNWLLMWSPNLHHGRPFLVRLCREMLLTDKVSRVSVYTFLWRWVSFLAFKWQKITKLIIEGWRSVDFSSWETFFFHFTSMLSL